MTGAGATASALALSFAVGMAALLLGQAAPIVGAPVFAVVLGFAVVNFPATQSRLPGLPLGATAKRLLQIGIVLMGAGIDLNLIWSVGVESSSVLLWTVIAGLAAAALLGAGLGIGGGLRWLVGVGTVICGASAIAALAPAIRAKGEDIGYAIAVVFAFNLAAVLVFPPLGHLLGLSDAGFGLWAGTAINDTSAVVAAAYSYSDAAGVHATVVKLGRAMLIVPIVIIASAWTICNDSRGAGKLDVRVILGAIPWFIFLFVAAAFANTSGLLGGASDHATAAGKIFMTMALAAVGMQGSLAVLRSRGGRPFALGFGIWAVVASVSLVAQACQNLL